MSTATTHIKSEKQLLPALRFKEFTGEWDEILLDDFAQRGSGHTPSKSHPEYYNGSINWISLTDSKRLDKGFIDETNTKITQEGIDNSSAVLHPAGTVLLSRDAGVGKSAVMKHSMAVSQHFIVWKSVEGKSSNWFLYNWLQIMKPHFELIAVGNTIKTIGLPYFKKLKIVNPKFPEQHKIASFLSSVDDKIQQLTKKKVLLEQYKKGVIQQLFSGQLRFKDENGKPYPDWEEKFLGEITERNICYGVVQPGIEDDDGVKFIRGGDVFNGKISKDLRIISKDITDKYKRTYLKGGELIMSLVGYPGETAIVPIELAGANLARQVGLIDLKKEYDTGYIHFYINSAYGKKNLLSKTIGSAQQVINIVDLKKLKVPLPLKEEQQKIANYLSRIDTKIGAVNNQITQTRTFKKGLLQQMFVAA